MNFFRQHLNPPHFYFHEFLNFFRMNFDSQVISFFVLNQKVFKFNFLCFLHHLPFLFILIFPKEIQISAQEFSLPNFVYCAEQSCHYLLKSSNRVSKNMYSMVSTRYFYLTKQYQTWSYKQVLKWQLYSYPNIPTYQKFINHFKIQQIYLDIGYRNYFGK